MSFNSKDWLKAGVGAGVLAYGLGLGRDGGLDYNSTDGFGPSTTHDFMGNAINTMPTRPASLEQSALLNSMTGTNNDYSFPATQEATSNGAYGGLARGANQMTNQSNTGSWYKGVGDFLGSDAGKNTVALAAPIAQGLIGASATEKAAEMQADTYAKQLAADQARIAADNKRRNQASLAMAGGFRESGLGV